MNRWATWVIGAAVLTLAAVTTARAQMVDNPPFKNWSSFNAMASATLRVVTTEMTGDNPNLIDVTGRPGNAYERRLTYTLQNKNDMRVVVRLVETDVEPGSTVAHAPVTITYPAKVGQGAVKGTLGKSDVSDFKEGEEELTVDGKQVACKWVESTIKVGDETSTSKIWWSDKVPGGTVKRITTKKQGDKILYETTATLVRFTTGAAN